MDAGKPKLGHGPDGKAGRAAGKERRGGRGGKKEAEVRLGATAGRDGAAKAAARAIGARLPADGCEPVVRPCTPRLDEIPARRCDAEEADASALSDHWRGAGRDDRAGHQLLYADATPLEILMADDRRTARKNSGAHWAVAGRVLRRK